ncbi:DsbA family protein [Halobaculum sp. MBLA0147]|uniref:DsbA family oxidoreductase n=1 Tax=Halobaculum sp. MBLA0147 TaxID=3079934 RepID=UPI0035269EF0
MTPDDDTLAVYSDFVCPFCYLGRAALREYLADAADPPTVEWRLFDLRGYKRGPDGDLREDVDDGKDDDYFEQVRENVARLRETYDVEMRDFDDLPEVDSWDTQQAALYVRQTYDEEQFHDFYDAVMDAYWRDGDDIADPDVVAEIAESVGVGGDEVRSAMADERLAEELANRFDDATELGISGIPTFVYDGHAARGAVPPEHLERLVEGADAGGAV